MNNLSAIKIKWFLAVLILSGLIIGGSYLYTKQIKKSASSAPPAQQKAAETPPGVKAAQKISADYPQFVKRAFIQQQIEGNLKSTIGNSWILEAGGKSIILTNQGTNKILFTKIPKIATGSSKVATPVEIKSEEVKIGDLLSITQIIDWQTGKITIQGITVLPPP